MILLKQRRKLWIISFIFMIYLQYLIVCEKVQESTIVGSHFRSYVAICAVAKNERDIREWVEYHYQMGIGKFYIFDNGEIDETQFLKDYIEKGIVEVTVEKNVAPQLRIYHNCIEEHKIHHQWIAFIDIDEFIVTKDECSIPSILKRYEEYGGLTLNWKILGSSGHKTKPPGGVLKNYWKCFSVGHLKTIVNTKYARSHRGNPHAFSYHKKKYSVDTDFVRVSGAVNPPRNTLYEIMYLHHYHLKSWEEYDVNRKRGRASTTKQGRIKSPEYFQLTDSRCIENCTILHIPETPVRDCPINHFQNTPISFD